MRLQLSMTILTPLNLELEDDRDTCGSEVIDAHSFGVPRQQAWGRTFEGWKAGAISVRRMGRRHIAEHHV
ncbi:unnamed protein product [Closterium sp. Yama58-4]|nr:unnamed protein product [Closterium sp. Yama58-4]